MIPLQPQKQSSGRSVFLVVLFLLVAVAFVYWRVDTFDFVNYDDQNYVFKNPHLSAGFTAKGQTWAFTTFWAANWHPLTWLSHMLDYQLFGLRPAGHHLMNLLFHLCNTILLFFVLRSMTGAFWRCALVAALFGLHPQHVESVAWIAERKDVLSCFFMLATVLFYTFFVKTKRKPYYVFAVVLFALGLMSKPMLVSLPFLLLLLDFWPFGRFSLPADSPLQSKTTSFQARLLRLAFEKTPFFILSFASCVVTIFAQKAGNAIATTSEILIPMRLGNALISYATYIRKMFWPDHLAFYYPLPPGKLSAVELLVSCAVILFLCFVAIRTVKKRPYIIIGLLWFFITLIPVIGLVQVGSQAMADRYTYISLIGPFISIVWLLEEAAQKNRLVKTALVTSVLVILFVFAGQSRVQAGYWKNDLTLADHALAVTQNNFIAYNLKGNYLLLKGSYDDAAASLTKAVSICPILKTSLMNIGWIRLTQNRPLEAINFFEEVLKGDSTDLLTNLNCGKAYSLSGDRQSAIRCFSRALAVDSTFYPALYNLALTYGSLREFKTCRQLLIRAIKLHPEDPDVYRALGTCSLSEGKKEEAQQWFEKSLSLSHGK